MSTINKRHAVLNERQLAADTAEFLRLTSIGHVELTEVVNHNAELSGEVVDLVTDLLTQLTEIHQAED